MRVVVFGATGNVGTSVLPALVADPGVDEIVGVARRRPDLALPKPTWPAADITTDDLAPAVQGADVVVLLAWLIQPSHDERVLQETNVRGSERVFSAVAAAGVPALVYASSVGAYSPGPKHRPVDESWPTNGIPTSFYARHKAIVERLLDRFEAEHPHVRVVRLRLALVFKREAAAGVARLFLGPLVPRTLLRRRLVPGYRATGSSSSRRCTRWTSARRTAWRSSAVPEARSTSPPIRCSTRRRSPAPWVPACCRRRRRSCEQRRL